MNREFIPRIIILRSPLLLLSRQRYFKGAHWRPGASPNSLTSKVLLKELQDLLFFQKDRWSVVLLNHRVTATGRDVEYGRKSFCAHTVNKLPGTLEGHDGVRVPVRDPHGGHVAMHEVGW